MIWCLGCNGSLYFDPDTPYPHMVCLNPNCKHSKKGAAS